MQQCNSKHTKYQPTDEEWRCPKCGSDSEKFWIEDNFGADGCELLHETDTISVGRKFVVTAQPEKPSRRQSSARRTS